MKYGELAANVRLLYLLVLQDPKVCLSMDILLKVLIYMF
jgi:hypothetical protein